MKKTLLTTLVLLCSCTAKDRTIMISSYEGDISDAPGKVICELHSLNDLGDLDSFSIVDDTCFAVVSGRSVVTLFNTTTGEEIRQIGHSGRAKNEYLAPTLARTCNGKIFVWSSSTLQFQEYSKTGEHLNTYKYESAIRDFFPTKDKLIIYTAGKRQEHLIDIYDLGTKELTKSLTTASKEHQMLAHSTSVSPMFIEDGILLYMPYDKQTLYKYFLEGSSGPELIADINCESFTVREIDNNTKRRDYLRNNPMNVLLMKKGNALYFLTKEVTVSNSGNNRYYSLYKTDLSKGTCLAHYKIGSLSQPYLFNVYKSTLYYIQHEVSDNNDRYYLKELNI